MNKKIKQKEMQMTILNGQDMKLREIIRRLKTKMRSSERKISSY